MIFRRPSSPHLMPIYVDLAQVLGLRFGVRDLITVPMGRDLGHMRMLGWSFPRTVGREVEGGGVVRDSEAA